MIEVVEEEVVVVDDSVRRVRKREKGKGPEGGEKEEGKGGKEVVMQCY